VVGFEKINENQPLEEDLCPTQEMYNELKYTEKQLLLPMFFKRKQQESAPSTSR
jgi:hypothetical protein